MKKAILIFLFNIILGCGNQNFVLPEESVPQAPDLIANQNIEPDPCMIIENDVLNRYNTRHISGEVYIRQISLADPFLLKSVVIKTANFDHYEIVFVGPELKDIPTVNEVFRGDFLIIELVTDFDPETHFYEGRILKNITEHLIWIEE